MPLKQGLWLTLLDEGEEATPVPCVIVDRSAERLVLEALIPPQVYPVKFVEARLRLDGHFLGKLRLTEPIVTVTHELLDLRLEFPLRPDLVQGNPGVERILNAV
jgi:hypothetical protein